MDVWFFNEGTVKVALVLVLWLCPLVMLLLSKNDESGWLVQEFAIIVLWLLMGLIIGPMLWLIKDAEITLVFLKNFITGLLFFVITSGGWKYWRIKKPNSRAHKAIENALTRIMFAGIVAIAFFSIAGSVAISLVNQEFRMFLGIAIGATAALLILVFLFVKATEVLRNLSKRLSI